MPRARTALLLTGTAGLTAAALARRSRLSGVVDEPAPVPVGRERRVTLADGVTLHVEEHGPQDAAGTVVMVHGYVQSNRVWDRQVAALLAARPDLRVVTYDHRGHGASDRTPAERAHLQQLGQDLREVLEQVAPTGPVVVAGHSMGGMTLMSLVEQHPELVGDRLAGAALVGTSPGRLAEVTHGLPKAVARLVHAGLPAANERNRRREDAGRRPLPNPVMKQVVFGRGARPSDVRAVLDVMARCSAHTVADFHATFEDHDRLEALQALADVPVLVAVGTADRLCPVEHSREMARVLPHAELVVCPGAGHMVMLERDTEVSAALLRLCAQALPEGATAPRRAAPRAG